VLVVSVIVLTTLYPTYRTYYQAHTLSILLILAALALGRLPRQGWPWLAAVLMLFAAGAGSLLRGSTTRSQDYRPALPIAQEIQQILPPDTVFAGLDPLYHHLYDQPFFEQQAILLLARQQEIEVDAAWQLVGPQAVAVMEDYPLPPAPGLLDYIEQMQMQCVQRWQAPTVGRVVLYALPEMALQPDASCRSTP